MSAQHPSREEREAARKYLEHDYAGTHLSGAARREGNRHASEIDERHPRARDIAMTGTVQELGQLPKHLAEHQRQLRRHAGISSEQAAHIRREYRSRHAQTERDSGAPEGPGRRERAQQGASRALGLAGSGAGAVADTGWGQAFGEMFVGAFGLSIFYLLITRVAAAGKLAQGASTIVRAVVSPVVDPLNPRGIA